MNYPLTCPAKDHALLTALARSCVDTTDFGRVSSLLAQVRDWDRTLSMVQHHGLMPVLHSRIETMGSHVVPASIRERIERWFRQHALRALLLARGLSEVAAHLKTRDIQFLALKGPALATILYGDISSRVYGDIDLLIHPNDFARAKLALAESGYRPLPHLTEAQEKLHLHWQGERLFVHGTTGLAVDLHWRLLPPHFAPAFEFLTLWEQGGQVLIGGVSVRSLSHAHHAAFLCVHGAKHGWGRLSWICDLSQFCRKHGAEIRLLPQIARQWKCERMARVGFVLSQQLAPTGLDQELLSWGKSDSVASSLAQEVCERIGVGRNGRMGRSAEALFFFRGLDSHQARAKFLVGRLCLPSEDDLQAFRLPRVLAFAYWILRPLRLGCLQAVELLRKWGLNRPSSRLIGQER